MTNIVFDLNQPTPDRDTTFEFGPLQTLWLRHLRSPALKQDTDGAMMRYRDGNYYFCCMGVAAHFVLDLPMTERHPEVPFAQAHMVSFFDPDSDTQVSDDTMLPGRTNERLGMHSRYGDILDAEGNKIYVEVIKEDVEADQEPIRMDVGALWELNDDCGLTFAQIADFIEAYPRTVFAYPA